MAYIGLVALALFAIRFVWAPYSLWKEQGAEIGGLKLELTKPERMVMEHLAGHRAKARAELAAKLEDFQTLSFYQGHCQNFQTSISEQMTEIRRLQAMAGVSEAFNTARGRLLVIVQKEAECQNEELALDRKSQELLSLMQRYLFGALTAESLALQLPTSTEARKLP